MGLPRSWWEDLERHIQFPIVEHHSLLKALPVAVSPGFYSQQPDLAVQCLRISVWYTIAHGVQDTVQPFPYRFSHVLHHGGRHCWPSTSAIYASRCVFPRSMVCSRYPLPVLSAPSTSSSASSAHSAISTFPARIRSSIYRCTATRSAFPLPDDDFQQEDADVHSGGFYPSPPPVVSPHESDRSLFAQPHWVSGCALPLYSLHSCPLRVFWWLTAERRWACEDNRQDSLHSGCKMASESITVRHASDHWLASCQSLRKLTLFTTVFVHDDDLWWINTPLSSIQPPCYE